MVKKLTTEIFINKAKTIHENKYDYSLVDYKNAKIKVKIICKIHGEFEQLPSGHLTGYGCYKCSGGGGIVSNTNDFIEKANKIHNFKFDYSLTKYINAKEKIKIICKEHGVFEQTPNSHLISKICCSKCEFKDISKRLLDNPTGWNYTNWEKAGNNSKHFDSFKVYIIKCWNEEEEFYKVGKTFKTVKERFHNKIEMPYNYKVIKEIKGLAREISELENKLKNINKLYKYIPKIIFEGKHECYKKLEKYEDIS